MSTDLAAFLNARLDEDAQPWNAPHSPDCESAMGPPGPFPCNCGWAARVLREVESKRALITAITAEPHEYIPGDEFYSCSQAVDPYEDDPAERYPGSGCSDPDRAGQPCDCGRDARAERLLHILAAVYADHAAYPQEATP